MIGLFKRWFRGRQPETLAPPPVRPAGDGVASLRAGLSLFETGDFAAAEGCLLRARRPA